MGASFLYFQYISIGLRVYIDKLDIRYELGHLSIVDLGCGILKVNARSLCARIDVNPVIAGGGGINEAGVSVPCGWRRNILHTSD